MWTQRLVAQFHWPPGRVFCLARRVRALDTPRPGLVLPNVLLWFGSDIAKDKSLSTPAMVTRDRRGSTQVIYDHLNRDWRLGGAALTTDAFKRLPEAVSIPPTRPFTIQTPFRSRTHTAYSTNYRMRWAALWPLKQATSSLHFLNGSAKSQHYHVPCIETTCYVGTSYACV